MILTDLIQNGGAEIPLESGQTYKIEYKGGNSPLTLHVDAKAFTLVDITRLKMLAQSLADLNRVEKAIVK